MLSREEKTQIVVDAGAGNASASKQLVPIVYDELHSLADNLMRREHNNHTLQATALVNEAFIRMVDVQHIDWKSHTHFLSVSAVMMRRILVDHARQRKTAKRGDGFNRLTLSDVAGKSSTADEVDLLALDDALCALKELHERQAQVVELRYFGGMTIEEIAATIGVSQRTIKNDWRVARAWLRQRIGD